MLRVSCLLAAAITSHCISLFYGHEQLWNSLSPFGASLETSASVLFTTSEPGLLPTVGGVCIVNMLWFINSRISTKEGVYVWLLCPWICVHSLHMSLWPQLGFLKLYSFSWPQQYFILFLHHIGRIYKILYMFHYSTVVAVTTSTGKRCCLVVLCMFL